MKPLRSSLGFLRRKVMSLIMSSTISAVTYTSVYTDSEPDRAFWGADDEEAQRIHRHRQLPHGRDELEHNVRTGIKDPDYDEDDEDEEEEEEQHLAPADSAIVVPVDALVFPPEVTGPVIPPPSIDITIGARITVRPEASISLLPEAETLMIASTQALIDAVTAALPSPPLLPLPPSLHIPPPVDRRDDISKSWSSHPAKSEVGYGIKDTWVDLAEAIPKVAPMTMGEVNTRVTELAELHERDTQDLMTLQETVWIMEEEAYASREAWAHSIGLSQVTHQELQTYHNHVYSHETHIQAHQAQLQLQSTLIQTQHQRIARQPGPDARISDHQDASGNADSHI
ncbi:hypothetical protein Tco_0841406 [Tanacetum coccineum]|uniref:Uncharacterized protein n=1 Tax=Tanacetum coccineum TaxID=301880 RepID=A0ABQ5B0P4_9ASTR